MASVLPKGIIPFNGSGYCKPYTIRVVGDRIAIWLPDNCLVVNGATVDATGGLEAPSDMAKGWYMLPRDFPTKGQFSVYLRIEETDKGVSASFTRSSGNDASYVPIAQGIIGIGTDSGVTQLVKTAIVLGGGGDTSGLGKKDFSVNDTKVAEILASNNINVTTGGGGGGIQSVGMRLDTRGNSKVLVLVVDGTPHDICTFGLVNTVVGIDYDATNRTLNRTKQNLYALNDAAGQPSAVFVAVQHS